MADASSNSAHYYRGRERTERELADQAASIAARNIHLELADRYRELAQQDRLKRTGRDRDRLSSNDDPDPDAGQARG